MRLFQAFMYFEDDFIAQGPTREDGQGQQNWLSALL